MFVELDSVLERADVELRGRTGEPRNRTDGFTSFVASIETDVGVVEVEILEPLLILGRRLQHAADVDAAASALREADEALDLWEEPRRAGRERHDATWLPFGVE